MHSITEFLTNIYVYIPCFSFNWTKPIQLETLIISPTEASVCLLVSARHLKADSSQEVNQNIPAESKTMCQKTINCPVKPSQLIPFSVRPSRRRTKQQMKHIKKAKGIHKTQSRFSPGSKKPRGGSKTYPPLNRGAAAPGQCGLLQWSALQVFTTLHKITAQGGSGTFRPLETLRRSDPPALLSDTKAILFSPASSSIRGGSCTDGPRIREDEEGGRRGRGVSLRN